jgi:hypothetical protein
MGAIYAFSKVGRRDGRSEVSPNYGRSFAIRGDEVATHG